jgi:hypothetical protein
MLIQPSNEFAPYRTGTLTGISKGQILSAIPDATFLDTPTADKKVTMEWAFLANGQLCGIWDYRGARFSTYGPAQVFETLFGEAYSSLNVD